MDERERMELEQANQNLLARRAEQGRVTKDDSRSCSSAPLHQHQGQRQYPAREDGERTGSMSRLIAPDDVAVIQEKIRATRERAAERRRLEREREEAERAAYTGECYDCRDTGWRFGELQEPCSCPRGHAIREERRMGQVREIWREARIPLRQQGFTLATFPARQLDAYALVREFLGTWDGRRGLLLVGAYSTGKTGLMVALMREAAELYAGTPYRMRFMASVELMQALRPNGSSGHEDPERGALFDRLMRTRLLGLDDLGKDKPTDWVLDRLFTLFNYRSAHMLPTFVTTNYNVEELVERVGDAVADRLMEMCDGIEMDADAPNLRRVRGGS